MRRAMSSVKCGHKAEFRFHPFHPLLREMACFAVEDHLPHFFRFSSGFTLGAHYLACVKCKTSRLEWVSLIPTDAIRGRLAHFGRASFETVCRLAIVIQRNPTETGVYCVRSGRRLARRLAHIRIEAHGPRLNGGGCRGFALTFRHLIGRQPSKTWPLLVILVAVTVSNHEFRVEFAKPL